MKTRAKTKTELKILNKSLCVYYSFQITALVYAVAFSYPVNNSTNSKKSNHNPVWNRVPYLEPLRKIPVTEPAYRQGSEARNKRVFNPFDKLRRLVEKLGDQEVSYTTPNATQSQYVNLIEQHFTPPKTKKARISRASCTLVPKLSHIIILRW